MENTEAAVMNVTAKEKVFAILAYVGILWFIGMWPTDVRESSYLKNHVNNGMILFICEMLLACIPFAGWAVEIAALVFAIMGIVKAATNKKYTIPFIGEKVKLYW